MTGRTTPSDLKRSANDPDRSDVPNLKFDRWQWPRRLLMAGALALGIAFSIHAVNRAPANDQPVGAVTDSAVIRQSPGPGDRVLNKTTVGVQLRPGFDGRITVDGVEIPEDQMDGVIPTDSPSFDNNHGLRPNNKDHVFFTPGPDKVVTGYSAGEVHVSIRFWLIEEGEESSETIGWAFFSY